MIALAVIGAFVLVAFGPALVLALRSIARSIERRAYRRTPDDDRWRCEFLRICDVDHECSLCVGPKLAPPPREPLHSEGEYR